MAAQLDISEAKARMDEVLARVRSGEEIVLSEGGTPFARIVPASTAPGARVFGDFAGKIHIADNFTAPLPEDELAEWEK